MKLNKIKNLKKLVCLIFSDLKFSRKILLNKSALILPMKNYKIFSINKSLKGKNKSTSLKESNRILFIFKIMNQQ
jgi:hypothetical protein